MTEIDPPALRCANHPDRETMLRCNRCEKPICYQCAVRTPVGYRCPQCVREQRAVYYNSQPYDLPIGVAITLATGVGLGLLAYLILPRFGFFSLIIAFFAGPAAGGLVAEIIRRGLRKRRAQGMKLAATAAWVVGVLLAGVFLASSAGAPWLAFLISRWVVLVFAGLAASALAARLL